MASPSKAGAALAALREDLVGDVFAPGDVGYDEARAVFNALIDRRPAVITQCVDEADVVRAVRFGRELDLKIAVRGGGHRYHWPSDGCSRYQRAHAPNSHHVPSGSTSMRPPMAWWRCCGGAVGHHAAATIARVSRSASAKGSANGPRPRCGPAGGALP